MKTLSRAALLICFSWLPLAHAAPLEISTYDDVVYLADSESTNVQRYSLADQVFIEPLGLSEQPMAVHTDASGIYVSYGTRIVKLGLDGTGEATFRMVSEEIYDIEATDQYLIMSSSGYLQVLNKTSGTLIDEKSFWYPFSSISLSADGRALFSASTGISPADVYRIPLEIDGSIGELSESPYHGDYYVGDNLQAFPTQSRIVDSSGNVYNALNLTYAGSLGGFYQSIGFWQGFPVVLRNSTLYAYNGALLETGLHTLTLENANELVVHQDSVVVFGRNNVSDIQVEAVAISELSPADPVAAIDPSDLAYQPDALALDVDGDTLYLLSKAQLNIFRWSISQAAYIESIPLTNAPDQFAYAPAQQRIYLSYANGAINYIDLESGTEQAFANLGSGASAMTVAGDYLVAKGHTGAWGSLSVFDTSGNLTDYQDWIQPTYSLAWDAVTGSIYYLSQWSPSDLKRIDLGSLGSFGLEFDSPYHDDTGWMDPIRVSENGKFIALATGRVVDDFSLLEVADVNPDGFFIDIAWMHGNVFSLEGVDSNSYSQVERWRADFSRDPDFSTEIFGVPLGLIPLSAQNQMLVIYSLEGKPQFQLLDAQEVDWDNDGVLDSQDLFPADSGEQTDMDRDGLGDNSDPDRDGDGVDNASDAFPSNASETIDSDSDGIGNNADLDDDSDGVLDQLDSYPLDPNESRDLDGDGQGDNSDPDRDGDGVNNAQDAFPFDLYESADTDSDGVGNNADSDDDNDGILDNLDRFPRDASESSDMDWDGLGDNSDPDRDGDYVPNDEDAFPFDRNESVDTDNDGIGNNADSDDDNDGILDDLDRFPLDANESNDMDWDGLGDNSDPDRDGDGVNNEIDAFPNNRNEAVDTDNDGIGNNADTDSDNDGVANTLDIYPYDAAKNTELIVADLLPLDRSNRWIFEYRLFDELTMTVGADRQVAGQTVRPLVLGGSDGGRTYLKVLNDQIQFFGLYLPVIYTAYTEGEFAVDIPLDKGINLMETGSHSGRGKLTINPTYGQRDMTWTAEVEYRGVEQVVVPAGRFTAIRTRIDVAVSTTIDGQQFRVDYFAEYWFAADVGLVKLGEPGLEMGLKRTVSAEHDADAHVNNGGGSSSGSGGGGGSTSVGLLTLLALCLAGRRRVYKMAVPA